MTEASARIEGFVQAAGAGNRLGLGPKALLRLGEQTLVERSVSALEPLCGRVLVAAPPDRVEEVAELVGSPGVDVIAGGPTRTETTQRLLAAADSEWLLLTDVAHPFVDTGLARTVLDVALRDGAAFASVQNADHVVSKQDGTIFCAGTLWTVQKPIACRTDELARGVGSDPPPDTSGGESATLQWLGNAGRTATPVPGVVTNLKITDAADWPLAQLVAKNC